MSSLRSGVEELASEDVQAASDVVLEEDLAELVSVGEALEAEVLRRLTVIDRRRSFERDGFVSTVAWLAARLRMSRSKAAELVHLARALHQMARVQAAFAAGEVSASAVRLLADARGPAGGLLRFRGTCCCRGCVN